MLSRAENVEVEPWVVLCAIRYGLPRLTYAHADALHLIATHAPILRDWFDTITADLRLHCANQGCNTADIDHHRAWRAIDAVNLGQETPVTADPFGAPDVQEWAQHVREDLVPKLNGSAATISLVPDGDVDVKFAVELGLSIMLDKPIIAVITPGTQIPERLARVADVIVEGHISDPTFGDRIQAAITKVLG